MSATTATDVVPVSSGTAKQLRVCARAFAVDLLRRRTERIEDVLDERQRDLAFARVHGVGAGLLQRRKIAQVGGARQHADGRDSARAPRE